LPTDALGARIAPQPEPSPIAAVIQVTIIPAQRAASVVHELFPHVRVHVDGHANAIVVMGTPDDVQSARTVVSGIDVKNPTQPSVEVVQLRIIGSAKFEADVLRGEMFARNWQNGTENTGMDMELRYTHNRGTDELVEFKMPQAWNIWQPLDMFPSPDDAYEARGGASR
jgi:type II secretory pathway component GspD/PulD (secretin)